MTDRIYFEWNHMSKIASYVYGGWSFTVQLKSYADAVGLLTFMHHIYAMDLDTDFDNPSRFN